MDYSCAGRNTGPAAKRVWSPHRAVGGAPPSPASKSSVVDPAAKEQAEREAARAFAKRVKEAQEAARCRNVARGRADETSAVALSLPASSSPSLSPSIVDPAAEREAARAFAKKVKDAQDAARSRSAVRSLAGAPSFVAMKVPASSSAVDPAVAEREAAKAFARKVKAAQEAARSRNVARRLAGAPPAPVVLPSSPPPSPTPSAADSAVAERDAARAFATKVKEAQLAARSRAMARSRGTTSGFGDAEYSDGDGASTAVLRDELGFIPINVHATRAKYFEDQRAGVAKRLAREEKEAKEVKLTTLDPAAEREAAKAFAKKVKDAQDAARNRNVARGLSGASPAPVVLPASPLPLPSVSVSPAAKEKAEREAAKAFARKVKETQEAARSRNVARGLAGSFTVKGAAPAASLSPLPSPSLSVVDPAVAEREAAKAFARKVKVAQDAARSRNAARGRVDASAVSVVSTPVPSPSPSVVDTAVKEQTEREAAKAFARKVKDAQDAARSRAVSRGLARASAVTTAVPTTLSPSPSPSPSPSSSVVDPVAKEQSERDAARAFAKKIKEAQEAARSRNVARGLAGAPAVTVTLSAPPSPSPSAADPAVEEREAAKAFARKVKEAQDAARSCNVARGVGEAGSAAMLMPPSVGVDPAAKEQAEREAARAFARKVKEAQNAARGRNMARGLAGAPAAAVTLPASPRPSPSAGVDPLAAEREAARAFANKVKDAQMVARSRNVAVGLAGAPAVAVPSSPSPSPSSGDPAAKEREAARAFARKVKESQEAARRRAEAHAVTVTPAKPAPSAPAAAVASTPTTSTPTSPSVDEGKVGGFLVIMATLFAHFVLHM